MNQERKDFLSLAIKPARVGIAETAWLLGFQEHDIPVLVSAGLLKPLGRPPVSGSKYFATIELQKLNSDVRWLAKASDAIVKHWRNKNAGRRNNEIPKEKRKHRRGATVLQSDNPAQVSN
jgi:hypothetical protein